MSHIILKGFVDDLQGENVTGEGVLESLRGTFSTIESLEEQIEPGRKQQDVLDKAADMAGKVSTGFTKAGLISDTSELEGLIALL